MKFLLYLSLFTACLFTQSLSGQDGFKSIKLENLSQSQSLLVSEYSNKFEYLSALKCIQISKEELFDYASKGDFKSSILSLSKKDSFRVSNFEYTSPTDYRWSAKSVNNLLTIDLKSSTLGIVGIINDLENSTRFILSPITEDICILSEQLSTNSPTCNSPISNCASFTADCGIDPLVDSPCNDPSCPSHLDILFLLTPEALAYYGSEELAITNMDLMIMDLERVWANSNILNTVDYQWKEFSYDVSFDIPCEDIACDLSNVDGEASFLRNLYNADIVTLITAPFTWNSIKACVSNYGPDEKNAFILQPAHNAQDEYTFVHEMGHIMGLEHGWVPQRPNCCGHGQVIFVDGSPFSTIMGTSLQGDIPYYSDPEIDYLGIPTGSINPVNGRQVNAAGWIRAKSCEVGDFRNSTTARAGITITLPNCNFQFELNNSVSENILNSYSLNWYLTENGLFDISNLENENLVGQGNSVIISNSMAWNPCENYFIHLVVSEDNNVITNQSLTFRGGACLDNVWCNGNEENKNKYNSSPSTWIYDNTNGFFFRSTRHFYLKDTIIKDISFDKYGREEVLHLEGRDSLISQYPPFYISEKEGFTIVSFYGETPDTLYNFNALPGDSWQLTYGGNRENLNPVDFTVLDTFTRIMNEQRIQGQILEFDHHIDGQAPYSDTVYENIGSVLVYLNPFDFFEHGPESRQGNVLRCFNNTSIGTLSFNTERFWEYDVDCDAPRVTNTFSSTLPHYELTISPNPFKENLNISNSSPRPVTARLFTLFGKPLKTIVLQPGRNTVSLSKLSSGAYFLISPEMTVVKVIKH